ncbi:MAG: DUF4293 family protein [Flavobacteriaceae bacterium]|nr:DUF4293 family protein [Flavobacteriaceae bacterium]
MIQRIQSVYLLLIIIVNVIYKLILNTFSNIIFPGYSMISNWTSSVYVYLIPTILISLTSLLLYKYRTRQLLLNRLNIFFQLLLLASSFDNLISFNIFYILLLINLVLINLANYGIKKDENLIKSIDRLR